MILRIIVLTLLGSTFAHAHAGKTNAEGCHTEKATGNYHCHHKDTPATVPTNPVNATVTPMPPLATDTKPTSAGIMKLDYDGFTVWLDCQRRGAVKFQYNAQHDTGNMKRLDTFYLDPS
jgi:endonuclease G, mitochondrial